MKMMRNALSAIFDIPDLDLSHLEQKSAQFQHYYGAVPPRRPLLQPAKNYKQRCCTVAPKIILLLLRGGIKNMINIAPQDFFPRAIKTFIKVITFPPSYLLFVKCDMCSFTKIQYL